ncbi:hypothetical protein SPRG_21262, partial [Saprolegnia parasitica CBS 223.65]
AATFGTLRRRRRRRWRLPTAASLCSRPTWCRWLLGARSWFWYSAWRSSGGRYAATANAASRKCTKTTVTTSHCCRQHPSFDAVRSLALRSGNDNFCNFI